MENELFVGGIPLNMDSEKLKNFMSRFGKVLYCRIATDGQGMSKGYAFASLETPELNEMAVGKYKSHGINFEIKKAVNRFENQQKHQSTKERKVFFSKLLVTITEKDLFRYFRSFGNIEELTLLKHVKTLQSRKCGFVIFADPESKAKVLNRKTHTISKHKFNVEDCLLKQELQNCQKNTSPMTMSSLYQQQAFMC
jgi:RNA recognition motif-containing protein